MQAMALLLKSNNWPLVILEISIKDLISSVYPCLYLAYNKMNIKFFVLCDGYGARRMEGETAYDPESGKMLPVPY